MPTLCLTHQKDSIKVYWKKEPSGITVVKVVAWGHVSQTGIFRVLGSREVSWDPLWNGEKGAPDCPFFYNCLWSDSSAFVYLYIKGLHLVLFENSLKNAKKICRWKEEEPLGIYGTILAGYCYWVKRNQATQACPSMAIASRLIAGQLSGDLKEKKDGWRDLPSHFSRASLWSLTLDWTP